MTTLRIELPPPLVPLFAPPRGELRYRVMRGGRGSGKSFTAAKMAAVWGAVEPLRILCARELQNSIAQSFHAELKNAINSCQWLSTQYDVGVDYLRHLSNGTEFVFKGLRHNIEGVKSMAQIDLVICEESETIPHRSWQDLLPTIRAPKSELWVIYNPKSPSSWVAETFDGDSIPPRTMVVTLNHDSNPWFSKELEEQRLHDQKTMPTSLYRHIWEGEYLLDDDASIIKAAWVESAIDAHLLIDGLLDGASTLGFDIADDGDDKCATVLRTGSVAVSCDEWAGREDELLKSCSKAYHQAQKAKAHIVYDAIGVGASAGAKFQELNRETSARNRVTFDKFMAGGKVTRPESQYAATGIKNKDFFSNIKAQMWWSVADRFLLTHQVVQAIKNNEPIPKYRTDQLISIRSDMPKLNQLKMELSLPMRDFDSNARVKVESKSDLRKREVPSPNIADAFIMAFAPIRRGLNMNPGNAQ